MFRRLRIFLLLFLFATIIAFLAWRSPAPTWDGSPIELEQKVEDSAEFLFLGDNGSGLPDQYKVAQAMERYCLTHNLSAVFMVGDNFYPVGVKNTTDPQWQNKFRDPYEKPCLGKIPFYPTLGNHDYKGQAAAQIAYSHTQNLWRMPHRFYSVQFGDLAKVIAIDTNILDVCGSPAHCVIDFLFKALKEKSIPNRIVFGHHPSSSSSMKYGPTLVGRVLRRLLCDTGATYISGHSHHLEHRQDLACSLDLFISGGGGAALYEVRKGDPQSLFAQSAHGFLSLRVTKTDRVFTFYDSELRPLYSYKHDN
jgi:tartrate-resistant acid phosphatase type 5